MLAQPKGRFHGNKGQKIVVRRTWSPSDEPSNRRSTSNSIYKTDPRSDRRDTAGNASRTGWKSASPLTYVGNGRGGEAPATTIASRKSWDVDSNSPSKEQKAAPPKSMHIQTDSSKMEIQEESVKLVGSIFYFTILQVFL